MTDYLTKRITIDSEIGNGIPTIRGTRITVKTILEFLLAGDKREDILNQYPDLQPEDIDACLEFAVLMVDNKMQIKYLIK